MAITVVMENNTIYTSDRAVGFLGGPTVDGKIIEGIRELLSSVIRDPLKTTDALYQNGAQIGLSKHSFSTCFMR